MPTRRRFRLPAQVGPRPQQAAVGPGPVLLLTGDEELADAVQRLAAAAGCTLHRPAPQRPHRDGGGPQRRGAGSPHLLLVGVDADAVEVRSAARGAEVIAVGLAPVDADWWQAGAELDAEHIAVLPEAESWLLEKLADASEGRPEHGVLLGVIGGCGGAGASVLAAAVATAAAERGTDTLLVDGDPLSGGLDLLLGADELPGLRWAELAGVSGRLRPEVLRSTVSVRDGLRLLAGDRRGASPPGVAAVESVLDASRRLHDLTVVDLPRRVPGGQSAPAGAAVGAGRDAAPVAAALGRCTELLLVVPATYRAAAAACCVLDAVRPLVAASTALQIVVRQEGAGLNPDSVADIVGAPLAGCVRSERDLAASVDRGEGLPWGRRTSLRAFAARWCAEAIDQEHRTGRP